MCRPCLHKVEPDNEVERCGGVHVRRLLLRHVLVGARTSVGAPDVSVRLPERRLIQIGSLLMCLLGRKSHCMSVNLHAVLTGGLCGFLAGCSVKAPSLCCIHCAS